MCHAERQLVCRLIYGLLLLSRQQQQVLQRNVHKATCKTTQQPATATWVSSGCCSNSSRQLKAAHLILRCTLCTCSILRCASAAHIVVAMHEPFRICARAGLTKFDRSDASASLAPAHDSRWRWCLVFFFSWPPRVHL